MERVRSQRRGLRISCLVMVLASLMAYAGNASAASSSDRGGTIVVAVRERLQNYDPTNYQPRITEHVLANIFDELVVRVQNEQLVADLAEGWTQEDATHWIFRLRKAVKFHDGTSLTAEDVKFTLDRVSQPDQVDGKTSIRQNLLPPMAPTTVVDPWTVRLTLKAPAPLEVLLASLSHIQIVPKAVFEKQGTAGFQKHPIGTGPFKFVSGSLDGETVLERFDGYWGGPKELGPPGPPKLDRVIFSVIPELSTAFAALKAGGLHILKGIPADMLDDLRRDRSLQVKTYPGTRTTWVAMNPTKPPFDKVAVRQAMNYAINSDAIIKNILHGQAVRMTGPVPPFSAYYDSSLKPYPYDPGKAKELLASAGYAGGFTVVLDTITPFKDIASAIVQDLKAVGLTATVRIWEGLALRAEALKGNRQMLLFDWGNAYRHPYDLLNPTLKTNGPGNYSRYSNKEVDALLDQGASTTDPKVARAAYYKAQAIIYEEAPWVFGWIPNEIEAASAKLQNWIPGPDGWSFLTHVTLTK